ncbi:ABC transporter substrate-binding protein [Alicyclobacillus mengziensis]|uniref:ABC transporter substrate-binding protein n=1 Tax=Alicyclobacillus mengziensis TaxID=2931921 RepID=A0A9X7Z623_9BACL|nr:ABC transporter substrate-binding protein [Alicyclobacillus mengziensis]QSO46937.1 ABC transporter substrate-binding protein [Alicyclobacillus mengziensis]
MKSGMVKAAAIAGTVLIAGGAIVGCGTTNSSNTSGGGNTSTTNSSTTNTSGPVNFQNASGTIVWAAAPITHTGLRAAMIKAFEKQYPKIKVTLQNMNTSTNTDRASLTTTIGGGSSTPDVYMGDVIWPAQFAASQLAMPLNSVLPSSFWNRFSAGLVKGATYKGKIYAAPFFADSGFLWYRKDLLKKAHLPVPTTWAQVKSESETLQKDGYVKYGFVWQGNSYEGLTCDFMEYLTDAGGQVLNSKGQPNIDTPQALKALTFMRSLITSSVTPSAVTTFEEPQSENVFLQGEAAFQRNWTYVWNDSQTSSNSKIKGKVGVTVLPTFGGPNGYSTIGGWDLYVNPHSKNVAADLAFINWMTGKQAQTILAKDYSELPTNAAVASNPAIKKISPVFNIVSKTHYVSRPDQSPNYPAISKAIYTNVNAALEGSVSPSAALKTAQQQIKQAVSGGGL